MQRAGAASVAGEAPRRSIKPTCPARRSRLRRVRSRRGIQQAAAVRPERERQGLLGRPVKSQTTTAGGVALLSRTDSLVEQPGPSLRAPPSNPMPQARMDCLVAEPVIWRPSRGPLAPRNGGRTRSRGQTWLIGLAAPGVRALRLVGALLKLRARGNAGCSMHPGLARNEERRAREDGAPDSPGVPANSGLRLMACSCAIGLLTPSSTLENPST